MASVFSDIGKYSALVIAVLFGLGLLSAVKDKLHIKLPANFKDWQSYLVGQGFLLCVFLLAGAALGWLSVHYGVDQNRVNSSVKILEYRQLALTGHPLYEEVDSGGFNHLAVVFRSLAPQASRVGLRIVPDGRGAETGSPTFEGGDSAWTRVERNLSSSHVTLVIGEPVPGAPAATQADVLVVLSRE